MKNKKRKGFTLVELLVVIAILAILATVAILGYTQFTKKANIANDQAICNQMNLALQSNEALDNKARYAHEAVGQCQDAGFILENLTPSTANYNFAYDQQHNRFMLLDDEFKFNFGDDKHTEVEEENNYWIYVVVGSEEELKEANEKGFSTYLRKDFIFAEDNETKTLTTDKGIDVGACESVKQIKYKYLKEGTVEQGQDVVIRTNGGNLEINAEKDTVRHYGWVKDLKILAVSYQDCYHENGYVENLVSFGKGKFVVGESGLFKQTKEEIAAIFNANEAAEYVEGKDAQYNVSKNPFLSEEDNENPTSDLPKEDDEEQTPDLSEEVIENLTLEPDLTNLVVGGWTTDGKTISIDNELLRGYTRSISILNDKEYGNFLNNHSDSIIQKVVKDGKVFAVIATDKEIINDESTEYERTHALIDIAFFAKNPIKGPEVPLGDDEVDTFSMYVDYSCDEEDDHYDVSELQYIDLSNFDSSNMHNFDSMFAWDESDYFEKFIGLENLNTSNVESMNSTFSGCDNFETLDLSKWDVSKVNDFGCFLYGCHSLEELNISTWKFADNVDTDEMFYCCYDLSELDLSKSGLKALGRNMFYTCKSLTSIHLPGTLDTIGEHAFDGCSALTSIALPDTLETIEIGAFFECSSLTSIALPDTLRTIKNSAFYKCSSLANIYFDGTKTQWGAIDKVSGWDYGTGTYVIHCSDGDIAK